MDLELKESKKVIQSLEMRLKKQYQENQDASVT